MIIFSTSRRATCTCRWEDLKESEVDKIARIVSFRESLSKTSSFPPPHIFDLRRVNFQEVCVGGIPPEARSLITATMWGAKSGGRSRPLALSRDGSGVRPVATTHPQDVEGAGGQSEGPGATGMVGTDRGCGEGPGRRPRR